MYSMSEARKLCVAVEATYLDLFLQPWHLGLLPSEFTVFDPPLNQFVIVFCADVAISVDIQRAEAGLQFSNAESILFFSQALHCCSLVSQNYWTSQK